MVPTTQRTIMVGRFDVRSRAVRSRSGMSDDTGRGRWLTPRHVDGKVGAGRRRPGRIPLPPAPIAVQRTGETPLMMRALGLLIPIARNRIRFIAIAIRFRQNAVKHLRPGNHPFLLNRRVPGRNFVIAVACLGEIRRRHCDQQRPERGCAGCRCRRGRRRWSLQVALNPSGGGLKQIDPAHPLPVHGIPV